MSRFSLALQAEGDLDSIGTYTRSTWGDAQCAKYLADLEDACQDLADRPSLGRGCEGIRPGLCRHEVGKHVIFFRRVPSGVRILRFLHERMLPEIHSFEDDETGGP